MRNVTRRDNGGNLGTQLIDTNPVRGRLYKFRHDIPRVNPTLYGTDVAKFSKSHYRFCTAGVIFGPQRNAADDHDGTRATKPVSTGHTFP